jgi:hypothetical protein
MKKLYLFSAMLFGFLAYSLTVQCQQITVQTELGKQVVL